MPLYEFQCTACKKVFEELCSSSLNNAPVACPACASHKVKKLFSSFSAAVGASGDFACDNPKACPSAHACGGSCSHSS